MLFARPAAAHIIICLLLPGIISSSLVPALADEIPITVHNLRSLIPNDMDHKGDLRLHYDVKQPSDDGLSAKDAPLRKGQTHASRLHFGIGQFDVFDRNRRPAFNFEFRDSRTVFFLSPAVGMIANTDGGLYGYGAIYSKVVLGHFRLVPEFAIGAYRQGSSKDLVDQF